MWVVIVRFANCYDGSDHDVFGNYETLEDAEWAAGYFLEWGWNGCTVIQAYAAREVRA